MLLYLSESIPEESDIDKWTIEEIKSLVNKYKISIG